MANEEKVAAQVSGTAYSIGKDLVIYMKGKAKYVSRLEHNLSEMIGQLVIFYSRKRAIDEYLHKRATSIQASEEYRNLKDRVRVFDERCCKFINKYRVYWEDLPDFDAQNVSTASEVIAALGNRKPTVKTIRFFQLAKLSKRVHELSKDISDLIGKMVRENMVIDKKIEPVRLIPNDSDLPSSAKYVKEILDHFRAKGNTYIGVVGPIGVGKTCILKDLNNQLGGRLSGTPKMIEFDIVIWIDCDKKHDAKGRTTEMIQDVIMGRLGLERKTENSIDDNAYIISSFLQDMKYILLIDQFSPEIKLDEVGIGKHQEHGKVVIASNNMKLIKTLTDQQVEIHPLSEDDAMNLFQQVGGPTPDSRIKPIAKSIVKSCGGLQLVIKLVAFHLKGEKDEKVWNNVKLTLQSDTKDELQELAGVGKAYELVYEKLQKYQKKCLLFMTLFPSGQKVHKDYLVECWNAERFLELAIPLLRSARDRGAATLRDLTDQYLLENLSDMLVKMPTYFKKVAAAKEYPDENGSLSWAPVEKQILTEETLKKTKRLSLICYKSKLPDKPICKTISTLLMQCNSDLVSLGDTFFCNMKKLCILDLHGTRIASLPLSISSLVSLKSLYLNGCPLAELPEEVKALTKLEVLDIRGTSISSLADEVTELRCLRISFGRMGCNKYRACGKEEVANCPLDMITRLHQLEELTIEAGCCSQAWNGVVDRVVREVARLEMLNTLYFHFPKVKTLKKFVDGSKSLRNTTTHWEGNTLRSFDISVGCCEIGLPYGSEISRILPDRRLRFSSNEEISAVKELLRQASSFELIDHSSVKSLTDFDLKNVGALRLCVVKGCVKMASIVEMTTEETDTLGCLEKLHLVNLEALKTIWKGPISGGSLANLKDLTLFGCPKLTRILNFREAEALSSLEYVRVENCTNVKVIIEGNISEGANRSDLLKKVMTIDLANLSSLQRIGNTASMEWKSLVRIVMISCNTLGNVHEDLRNATKMETVELGNGSNRISLPWLKFIRRETASTAYVP